MKGASTVRSRAKHHPSNAAGLYLQSLICSNSPGKLTVTACSTHQSPLDQQFAMDTLAYRATNRSLIFAHRLQRKALL
jgi:hypothetical protein